MLSTHTLDSTTIGRFTVSHVDLLSKQVDLLSAAHFSTTLQWTKMVKLNKNDFGGTMGAPKHYAKSIK